jgi:hypothetical protein
VTTFYRDESVRITETAVEVGVHHLPIVEISYVWHERGDPTVLTRSRRVARMGLIAVLKVPVVVGAVVIANVIAPDQGLLVQAAVATLLIGVGVFVLFLLAPVIEFPLMALERSYDRGTEMREIWVRWRNHDLMLVRTPDADRFGKIYRAIQRAIEAYEG